MVEPLPPFFCVKSGLLQKCSGSFHTCSHNPLCHSIGLWPARVDLCKGQFKAAQAPVMSPDPPPQTFRSFSPGASKVRSAAAVASARLSGSGENSIPPVARSLNTTASVIFSRQAASGCKVTTWSRVSVPQTVSVDFLLDQSGGPVEITSSQSGMHRISGAWRDG